VAGRASRSKRTTEPAPPSSACKAFDACRHRPRPLVPRTQELAQTAPVPATSHLHEGPRLGVPCSEVEERFFALR